MSNQHWIIKRSAAALFCAGLSALPGCGVTTIDVSGSYPAPLTNSLPLSVGVYYPEDFRAHSFTEIDDNSGQDQYIVNSGESQMALFDTMLPSVFQNVVPLDNLDNVAEQHPGLDAVFVPVIQEFQLGLPEKTRLEVYEVWIKYNMRLSEPDGDYIADWNMSAYGKSPTETFQSAKTGVTEATNVALRDLAASFTLGFTAIPDVNEWLRERSLLADAP